MTWSTPPTRHTKAAKDDLAVHTRRVAIKMLRGLIFSSPVDTGRFRGNWVVGLRKPNTKIKSTTDTSNLGTGVSVVKRFKGTGSIFISNNLPYGQRLNDGHSKQAPANFVQRAIARALK